MHNHKRREKTHEGKGRPHPCCFKHNQTHRETAGEATSKAGKSDRWMSLTGWWRSHEQDGLEGVGYDMGGGYRPNRNRWMYHIGPRQGHCQPHWPQEQWILRESNRRKSWEFTLQSQSIMQHFGHWTLSSRALWLWWWARCILLPLNQQLMTQRGQPSCLRFKPESFKFSLHCAGQRQPTESAWDVKSPQIHWRCFTIVIQLWITMILRCNP